ncbi:hypothetical protein [Plantactinospora sp. CA-290183]|uniref:hypothetical protein n=1 Tax=Plantactinospora sp. CA-290183 TaxID=3240006 RepID=UPI003D9307AE
MSGHPSRLPADLRWVEAMLADLQRQIDQLAGELRPLSHVVHALTSLKGVPAANSVVPPLGSEEAQDGQ